MSEYPEDILETARNVARDVGAIWEIDPIAKAILAERERCAACVETYELLDHARLSPGSEMNAWWSGQERAYEIARRKILGLPLPKKEDAA